MVQVVPVIDIRHGVVVRAVAGDRANYQPIVSPLFEGCEPSAAVAGLMALHAFAVIYLADLDGIEGREGNCDAVSAIAREHPSVELWIDRGARTADGIGALLAMDNVSAVVGSETGITAGEMRGLVQAFGRRVILSLDHRAEGFVGEADVLADASCWPQRVIAMTLGSVGRNQGPNIEVLADVIARGAGRAVYAAGGVRDGDDLRGLAAMGVAGALVSSALHAQTITAGDLGEDHRPII